MRYIPHSEADRSLMLREIGVDSVEALFDSIPERLRLRKPLALAGPMSEPELTQFFRNISHRNKFVRRSFLGGGVYPHYVPAVIHALASRSEFFTAYTPYQPEISQGTLQAIFEFQTYMTQLTGLEVANASLYDGSTALAEAILMAHRVTDRRRFLIGRSVHPEYRAVVETYTRHLGFSLEYVSFRDDGSVDVDEVARRMGPDVAGVVVQSPNFLGVVEHTHDLAEIAHRHGALAIVAVAEALSLALFRPPGDGNGDRRADIAVGEAQSLGIPMSFGGPYLGFLATREEFIRRMPGRLVGMGQDEQGRRAFVLTLAAREQHIRRDKATSNICTNQSLCALMATIFLATLGPSGLRELAVRNLRKVSYLIERVRRHSDAEILFPGPRFNEVVIRPNKAARKRLRGMRERGVVRGIELGTFYPELDGALLIAVTEIYTRDDINGFVGELR